MRLVGLTGSMGMGKSTAARMLRRMGYPVFDADAAVHAAMRGEAVPALREAFPEAASTSGIDRRKLSDLIAAQPERLQALEKILHPLVRKAEQRQRRAAAMRGEKLMILDIPLLFETGGEQRCDAVIVVTAPAFLQRQRIMKRPGMTEQKLEVLLAKQMPDREKRQRADRVIQTGLGHAHALRAMKRALRDIKAGRVNRRGKPSVPPLYTGVGTKPGRYGWTRGAASR